jgi:hypothetical protein
MPTAATTLTTEQMQAAYARLAQRDWPPLEELLRAVQRYELVVGQALRSSRHVPPELLADPTASASQRAAPVAQASSAAPRRQQPPPAFDHKRAASGERPDVDEDE